MAQRAYFPMPNFDYPPDQLVLLGQVISSPKTPAARIAAPLTPLLDLQHSEKANWGTTVSLARQGSVGVWAQFLAIVFGAGGDGAATFAHEDSQLMQFEKLETTFFEPTEDYLARSVFGPGRESVNDYIKKNPTKSVYMITGLKIARGAEFARRSRRAFGADIRVGADATAFSGVPVSGGPQLGFEKSHSERLWFDGSSDFVFAYRLRRIIVTWRTGRIKGKEFVRGATVLHHDEEGVNDPNESTTQTADVQEEAEIDSAYLDENDYGSDGIVPFGFKSLDIRDEDDGGKCHMIISDT